MKLPEKRKSAGKYADQLKLAIAREYLNSELGYKGLGKKYDIPSATVQDFVRWHRRKYPDDVIEPSATPLVKDKELEEANLKITALQMMIEIASKELGVDLVKKFGTRQSKK